MRDVRTVTREEEEPHHQRVPILTDAPGRAMSPLRPEPCDDDDGGPPSIRNVLKNGPFRSLWIAQICSQLAQNLTWITLGAYVAIQTHKTTLVSFIMVSAMLAQLFLSGFAGVLVDRASKRGVLFSSNVMRVALTLAFVLVTPLAVAVQTTAIIVLIFIANSVAQFFMPAEAATIPLLVEKRNLISATSLFNITFNACQVVPITLGLLIFSVVGIVPVLLGVAALYVVASVLVYSLPPQTRVTRPVPFAGSLHQAARHVIGDVREALHFLHDDPGLRLTIFQINVAPAFLFIFGTLGLVFVQQTFGLSADSAWILLLPAGVGLVLGALVMGRVTERMRKEDLINIGLLAMGVGVAVLGAVATIVHAFDNAAGHVGHFIAKNIHQLPPVPQSVELLRGLIPPAMVIAFAIGLAMSLSTIPAQTLVFERTSEEVRGRVLSLQQVIGGAVPIIPLLVIGPLADLFGTSSVMTALGVIIVLVGGISVRLDRGHQKVDRHQRRLLREQRQRERQAKEPR